MLVLLEAGALPSSRACRAPGVRHPTPRAQREGRHAQAAHTHAASGQQEMAMACKLMNAPEELVQQALDGLLLSSPHLARLDGAPDIRVVLDKEHDPTQRVSIISGGGSGHEPAHAGYVGRGMLTAAVAGGVFASPSAEAVLAAIRATTAPQGPGCLLIIKNYTGDRLHFGLAAEQAKSEGIKVEMVVVGEDVAIDAPGLAGRRGLAGTVFVHKVAGAAALAGASLAEVAACAQAAAAAVATLGVALRVCTLPGRPPSDRLKEGEIEIGLGIHGEPGVEKTQALPAQALTERMLARLAGSPFVNLQQGERVVLMVNNLGASTPLEMACVAREAVTQLQAKYQAKVERCFVGPFMTSLDMAGCSLTLLRLAPGAEGDEVLLALDLQVGAPGWPHASAKVLEPRLVPVPRGAAEEGEAASGAARPAQATPGSQLLERAVRAAAETLVAEAAALNELDAKVGDGDCGDTLLAGARAVLGDLGGYPTHDAAAAVAAVARSVRQSMGGSSGALYDLGFTAAARALKEGAAGGGEPSVAHWAAALRAGVEAISKYGGAQAGSRTMLDALLPAAEALEQAAAQGLGGKEAAAATAAAAAAGAQATADMAASAGRASYVPLEVLLSIPDPGAVAVAKWVGAVAGVVAADA